MPFASNEITYRRLKPEDAAGVEQLLRCVNWLQPDESGAFVPGMISGSFAVYGAFAADAPPEWGATNPVGMARAISDGVSDGYIQDVAVAAFCRRRGIGGELVKLLLADLRAAGVDWIGLVGVPGTRKFYEELGFSELPGHIPMHCK